MFDNPNILELALSFGALATGIVAVFCAPALAPLGVPVALMGAGGILFGHW